MKSRRRISFLADRSLARRRAARVCGPRPASLHSSQLKNREATMRRSRTAMAVLGLAVLLLASFAATPVPAQGQAALTGQVTSAEEGPMEGVVVSAKKAGSTIMVSVVSDQAGRYSFPAARLHAGQSPLSIRAVGYDLDGPRSADIAAARANTAR